MQIVRFELNVPRVVSQWRDCYPDPNSMIFGGRRAVDVLEQLRALPETATREEVNTIIGHDSWTTFSCGACFRRMTVGVRLADDFDVCFVCVRKTRDLCVDVELELRKQ